MKEFFLQPGKIIFSIEPLTVTTILGSCVAVCIFDKEKKTGGMCHYYLPTCCSDGEEPDKYGETAIPNLLKKFKQNGSKKEDLVVKIVGGGHVIENMEEKDDEVGKENIRMAISILKKYEIHIEAKAIGGFLGRKVRFETNTGKISFKNILKNEKEDKETRVDRLIKVLIIDDSSAIRKIVKSMIERFSEFVVIGEASDPMEAEAIIKKTRPDLLTLDINMPKMDGVTYLATYRKKDPIPTIILTSLNNEDSGPVLKALENGAFDYIKKPALSEIDSLAPELHEKLLLAHLSASKNMSSITDDKILKENISLPDSLLNTYILAIGASTGGTEAIREILIRLPKNIPPTVIVQHIPPVFSKAFADRLNDICEFEVKEAETGDELKPCRVLIAPGGRHLAFTYKDNRIYARLTDDPPVNRFRPSVDYMFNNVSEIKNKKIIAVLLTGMGDDGARGLLKLQNIGAVTIAQDEATSAVYGMPKAAKDLGAVKEVASIFKIPYLLSKYIR